MADSRDEEAPLPVVVTVMAEHGGTGLWDRSPEYYGDVDPEVLGISAHLTARLEDWVRRFEEHAGRWDWGPPPRDQEAASEAEWAAWTQEGLTLAHDLQAELDARGLGIEVTCHEDGEDHPIRQRRGP